MIFFWCKKLLKTKKFFNFNLLQKNTNTKDVLEPKNEKKSLENKENFVILFGPKPLADYNCPYNCRFSSNDQELLKKHIKKYHSLRSNKFQCSYCKVSFRNVKRLEIHKVIYCTATNISLSL